MSEIGVGLWIPTIPDVRRVSPSMSKHTHILSLANTFPLSHTAHGSRPMTSAPVETVSLLEANSKPFRSPQQSIRPTSLSLCSNPPLSPNFHREVWWSVLLGERKVGR
ncbi:hypothetical protein JAAARDRAFT_63629 [Jaapia argillacea MUCL 33604]|uniref:Uncharacterized protein n=1 Tax=Jaapia argillacea MUCL 33604 TaxID=933084 RepID=A0A067P722_9AGAM|nr:hypothetical protein JAAARDRAFT_63629 [Jaapia argillacea MUCL 33604]